MESIDFESLKLIKDKSFGRLVVATGISSDDFEAFVGESGRRDGLIFPLENGEVVFEDASGTDHETIAEAYAFAIEAAFLKFGETLARNAVSKGNSVVYLNNRKLVVLPDCSFYLYRKKNLIPLLVAEIAVSQGSESQKEMRSIYCRWGEVCPFCRL